jgi:phosphatidylserine/phosphatidylglycerophosphate/cardiolipin synthase-like enzyme
LVWYSNEVETVTGVVNPNALIYESLQTGGGWSEPTIVAQTGGSVQPALATDNSGTLHLAWADEMSKKLSYTTHTAYDCSETALSPAGQAVYEAVRQEKFRPPTDPIPYCHNRYDRLLHAPNPVAAYSNQTPTPNGTFDKFAELAKTAEYEVVFATMWYDAHNKADNPGRVLGQAIAELYQKLKADPSRYPKGITVRLLLGNPPSFAFLPGLNNQTWWFIDDLRAAGVSEMKNDELGWNLEVGNFSGAWPHSHMKLMVVDGKTVQSVGYNMQYTHLPTDHPSGKGKGRVDLGLQVTGPAAQTSLRAFDDLWQASTKVQCANIGPNESILWIASCRSERATDTHVPEVLRYYIPEGEAENAFAIYRTEIFKESDEAHAQALASAQESMDVIHINFSLELICALNIFVDACTYVDRIDYMEALMQAVEQNGARARILVSDLAWVGIENNIAIQAFEEELARRGLSDKVEIRYFEQDMHIKAALIDQQLLIVGNQNFHYSAWGGQGTLVEYNLVTESPQAVDDFQRYFNYYWDRAKKRE